MALWSAFPFSKPPNDLPILVGVVVCAGGVVLFVTPCGLATVLAAIVLVGGDLDLSFGVVSSIVVVAVVFFCWAAAAAEPRLRHTYGVRVMVMKASGFRKPLSAGWDHAGG
jgi:hypothetical protein